MLDRLRVIRTGPFGLSKLEYRSATLYRVHMMQAPALLIDMEDRARLRERFFGADRTVLARL